ncbi:unnamed protein product [Wuchereria bancrofti]|uniref:Uncharacterized protein n=1 Tax=Wuchereria bancrofti TaxID=6293 RepID=A0A3P7DKV4_WUCBA|nr:unnamed protein product [Wuchereria bancrofti]
MAGVEDIAGQKGYNSIRDAKSLSDGIGVASSAYNNLEYLFDEKSESNDPTNLRIELAKYMTSTENTEALYRMFSQLLDRKLRELKNDQSTMGENGDDIKEDYMAEFIKPGTSASTIDLTDAGTLTSHSMSNPLRDSIRRRRRIARSQSMGNYI